MALDFRRRQLTIYQTNEGNGRFNFSAGFTDSRESTGKGGDAAASFILGYPTLDAHDYNYQFPGIRLNEAGIYFADDWRATKNLTINYGLRWDYFSPPDEVVQPLVQFFACYPASTSSQASNGVRRQRRGTEVLAELWPPPRLRLPDASRTPSFAAVSASSTTPPAARQATCAWRAIFLLV